jgi:hypothetical protein
VSLRYLSIELSPSNCSNGTSSFGRGFCAFHTNQADAAAASVNSSVTNMAMLGVTGQTSMRSWSQVELKLDVRSTVETGRLGSVPSL